MGKMTQNYDHYAIQGHSVLIEKIRCWAMDHGHDQAAGSGPSDLPRRMPNVRTYCVLCHTVLTFV